ncbi:hypothetical protein J4E90_010711 [Alternaria incomplexa]|uniref:uncharacterized protein n=1 Tax=Alternaria incomplexa TaxID=1187928 RepID=UPI00222077DE|nr:uncharacterized protein J4E90_010711 [Alternaria incomplexa]KAI4906238.1 hypothetical protein J4E90_010711 [Alternaria incomplexa]
MFLPSYRTAVTYAMCAAVALCASPSCRELPQDHTWPSPGQWNVLNKAVNGKLVSTVPENSSTSVQSAYFQTEACSPFTERSKPCELGNYSPYTITVSSAKDIQAGVRFAQKQNIRLVIKNTGHDFMGKNVGAGSLGLWTHKLKSVEVISNYNSTYYSGPAVKMGAGVVGEDALPVVSKAGLRIVSGSCPTVGLDGVVAVGSLSFSADANESNDTLWAGVEAWLSNIPALVDGGATAIGILSPTSFSVSPLVLPDRDEADVQDLIAPVTTKLDSLGLEYSVNVTTFPTFMDFYNIYFIPPEWQLIDRISGGRFVPRPVLQNNTAEFVSVLRDLTETTDAMIALVGVGSSTRDAIAPNAVAPQWREANMNVLAQLQWQYNQPWNFNLAQIDEINNVIIPKLEAVTPGAGSYLNEANFANPTWKEDFYGGNYDKLRKIKKEYDPDDLFYGPTIVGSDAWNVASDGRLCRA